MIYFTYAEARKEGDRPSGVFKSKPEMVEIDNRTMTADAAKALEGEKKRVQKNISTGRRKK